MPNGYGDIRPALPSQQTEDGIADSKAKKAVESINRPEGQWDRAKRLFVVGDYSEQQYETDKSSLETDG